MESTTTAGHPVAAGYACGKCGATGCKLWRLQMLAGLLCAPCACRDQCKSVEHVNADGVHEYEAGGPTDEIGWYFPAVPAGQGNPYHPRGAVPEEAYAWWRKLPTIPAQAAA